LIDIHLHLPNRQQAAVRNNMKSSSSSCKLIERITHRHLAYEVVTRMYAAINMFSLFSNVPNDGLKMQDWTMTDINE